MYYRLMTQERGYHRLGEYFIFVFCTVFLAVFLAVLPTLELFTTY